jgi:hypothetical protein
MTTRRWTTRVLAVAFVGLLAWTYIFDAGAVFAQTSSNGPENSNNTNWGKIGLVSGILVGAYIVSYLISSYKSKIQEIKRDSAAEEAAHARLFQPRATPPRGQSPNATATADRLPPDFDVPDALLLYSQTVAFPEKANVYSTPVSNSIVLTLVQKGETITVIGVTPSKQWALISRNEQPLGYIRITPALGALL